MKKYLLIALMVCAVDVSAAKLDVTPFIDKLEASYVYTNRGDHMAGAHYKAFEYPADNPWSSLNAGVIWDTSGDNKGIGGGFVSVFFNAGRVGMWEWKKTGMAGKVRMNFKIPKFDVGPFGGYIHRFGWLYGIHVAKGFG